VAGLSGGQKARLALARLLLTGPDVLLLDEPTNHLDIAGRQWLERFLLEFPGAVMIISHDRWLLDEVADRIVELARGKLIEYPGNYHAYREQRAVRQLEQQRVYEKQQTHIRHQQQYIQRYKTGQRAKEARGRQKKLERFIRDEAVEQVNEQDVMNLRLPAAPRSGDMVVSADGIGISYDEKALFADFSLVIHRGQRIGVIGPNGCGKSTLVRTLIGRQTPDQGHVRTGTNLSIGYYHQTHEHLDDSDTPVSYLKRCVPNNAEQSARDLAGAFLFSGIDQDKTFGVLSGGERTRAVLAGLMVGAHNLLVLDEPSNHLDIPSAERLEQSLRQYDGTLILITHDRMLLQDTVDELLVFEHHRVRHFLGSYREWLAAHRENQQVRGEAVRPAAQRAKTRAAPQRPVKDDAARAASQAASRKPQAAPRKSKLWYLSETELEAQIADLESRLAELDKQLADPELYRDKAAFTKVHEDRKILADQLEPLETEWLKRAEDA
jgi:ATP-binding cassette subfamily F protein 3